MLLSYSIKNWKSIKEKCTIDFRAKSIKDHDNNPNHLIDNEILPIIVIYGPNGGGKSNFINSISELYNIIFSRNWLEQEIFFLNNFKNVDTDENNIEWELLFQVNENKKIKYEIKIFVSKEKVEISKEKLTIIENGKNNVFFSFENNKYCFNNELQNIAINFDNKNKKIPLVTFLNQFFKFEPITDFLNEMGKIIFINKTIEISNNLTNNLNLFFAKTPIFNVYMLTDEQYNFIMQNKKKIINIFKSLDVNIVDLEIKKLNQFNYSIESVKEFNFSKYKKIPFELESCGTRELFNLLLAFLKYIEKDAIFFIDELDSHFHTKILRYFIEMFTHQKKTKSQLIYTSHDIPTLDKDLFRRDEIYFAAINESYFTDLISLNEFGNSVRNNQSYSKLYLDGKIGYDPYIDYSLKEFNDEQ